MAISFRGLSDDRGGGENGVVIVRLSEKMFTKFTVGFLPGGLEQRSPTPGIGTGPRESRLGCEIHRFQGFYWFLSVIF